LHLLQEIAVAANQATHVGGALQTCLDRVCVYLGWPVGLAYLPAEDGTGRLAPAGIWHLEQDERFQVFRAVTEASRFAPGTGLPGRVLQTGRPEWVSDVTGHPGFPRARQARDLGVRAALAFPVKVGGDVAAVLE